MPYDLSRAIELANQDQALTRTPAPAAAPTGGYDLSKAIELASAEFGPPAPPPVPSPIAAVQGDFSATAEAQRRRAAGDHSPLTPINETFAGEVDKSLMRGALNTPVSIATGLAQAPDALTKLTPLAIRKAKQFFSPSINQPVTPPAADRLDHSFDVPVLETIAKGAAELRRDASKEVSERFPVGETVPADSDPRKFASPLWWGARGPENAAQLGGQIAMRAIPVVGPALSIASYGASEGAGAYDQLYNEAIQQGRGPDEAHRLAQQGGIMAGAANAGLGNLSLNKILGTGAKEAGKAGLRRIAKRIGEGAASEGITEGIEQNTPGLAGSALGLPYQFDPMETATASVLGAVMGGGAAGIGSAVQRQPQQPAPVPQAAPPPLPQQSPLAVPPPLPVPPTREAVPPPLPPQQPAVAPVQRPLAGLDVPFRIQPDVATVPPPMPAAQPAPIAAPRPAPTVPPQVVPTEATRPAVPPVPEADFGNIPKQPPAVPVQSPLTAPPASAIPKPVEQSALPMPQEADNANPILAGGDLPQPKTGLGRARAIRSLENTVRQRAIEKWGDVDPARDRIVYDPAGAKQLGLPYRAGEKLAQIFGNELVPVRAEGRLDWFNGSTDSDPKTIYFNTNYASADTAPLAVIGHELEHSVRRQLGEDRASVVEFDAAFESAFVDVDKAVRARGKTIGRDVDAMTPEEYDAFKAEMLRERRADFVGENVIRPEFWQRLADRAPDVFKRTAKRFIEIIDQIKATLKLSRHYQTEQWLKKADLEGLRNKLADMLVDFQREGGRVEVQRGGTRKPVTGFENMDSTVVERLIRLGGISDEAYQELKHLGVFEGQAGYGEKQAGFRKTAPESRLARLVPSLAGGPEGPMGLDRVSELLAGFPELGGASGSVELDSYGRPSRNAVIDWLAGNLFSKVQTGRNYERAERQGEDDIERQYLEQEEYKRDRMKWDEDYRAEVEAQEERDAIQAESRGEFDGKPASETDPDMPFQEKRKPEDPESLSTIMQSRQGEASQAKSQVRGQGEMFAQSAFADAAGNTPSAEKKGKPRDLPGQGVLFQEKRKPEDVDPLGYYSKLSRVVDEKMSAKMPKGALTAMLDKAGIKAEEREWTGIDEWLKGQPVMVSKADVQDYLNEHRIEVREVVKGESPERRKMQDELSALARLGDMRTPEEDTQYERLAQRLNHGQNYGNEPKFSGYQLKGGENYRELLLTLPNERSSDTFHLAQGLNGWVIINDRTDKFADGPFATLEKAHEAIRDKNEQYFGSRNNQFRSSHFDEPNILAHIRFNERTDADGKRVMLLEEVQSDWHQAGRKKGYGKQEKYAVYRNGAAVGDFFSMDEAKRAAGSDGEIMDLSRPGTPDAPFKKTWHELALKRALRWAAENGFDRVAWTTGDQQAERYDLSKQVDHIDYRRQGRDRYELGIVDKRGQEVALPKDDFGADELEGVVGKEVAQKIINGEGKPGGNRKTLSGLDLKVGGEGMKGFYDKMIPDYLRNYTKKWGGKIGQTTIDVDGKPETVHSLDMTPVMRDSIMGEGQILFQEKYGQGGKPPRRNFADVLEGRRRERELKLEQARAGIERLTDKPYGQRTLGSRIREEKGAYTIYDRTGEYQAGPYASKAEAEDALNRLRKPKTIGSGLITLRDRIKKRTSEAMKTQFIAKGRSLIEDVIGARLDDADAPKTPEGTMGALVRAGERRGEDRATPLESIVDSGLRELAKRHRGKPNVELESLTSMQSSLEYALGNAKRVGEGEPFEVASKTELAMLFGPDNLRKLLAKSGGKASKALETLGAAIDKRLSKVYRERVARLVEKVDEDKLWNDRMARVGGTDRRAELPGLKDQLRLARQTLGRLRAQEKPDPAQVNAAKVTVDRLYAEIQAVGDSIDGGLNLREQWNELASKFSHFREMTKLARKIRSERDLLQKLKDDPDTDPQRISDQEAKIEALSASIDKTALNMDWKEARGIYEALKTIEALSKRMNEVRVGEKAARKGDAVSETLPDIVGSGVKELPPTKKNDDRYVKGNVVTHNLGVLSKDLENLFLMVTGGRPDSRLEKLRLTMADSMSDRDKAVGDLLKKVHDEQERLGISDKEIEDWRTKRVTYDVGGDEHIYTGSQLMNLYLLWTNPDARTKLLRGGFKEIAKRALHTPGKHVTRMMDEDSKPDPEATAEEIMKLLSPANLSAKQIAYADAMRRIKNEYAANEGNQATLRMLGYEKFLDDLHWRQRPDRTDRDFKAEDLDAIGFGGKGAESFENLGWLQERVPHGHALLIEDAFASFHDQVQSMANMVHLAEPLSDIMGVLNHPDVLTAINERHGRAMSMEMRNSLLRSAELGGNKNPNAASQTGQTAYRLFAIKTLGLNIKSGAKNWWGGAVTLAAELNRTVPGVGSQLLNSIRILKPAPLFGKNKAALNDLTNESGYFFKRWNDDLMRVFGSASGMAEPVTGLAKLRRKMINKSLVMMKWAEQSNAVRAYQILRGKGYSKAEAARIVERATRETQNASTAMEETPWLASIRDSGASVFLPFMNQIFVQYNFMTKRAARLKYAMRTGKDKGKAWREFGGAAAALVATAAFNASLNAAWWAAAKGALTDKDKDKKKKEQTRMDALRMGIESMAVELAGDINPIFGKMVEPIISTAAETIGAEEGKRLAAFKKAITWSSDFTSGMPPAQIASQIGRTVSGAADLAGGKLDAAKIEGKTERLIMDTIELMGLAGLPTGGLMQTVKLGAGLAGKPLGELPKGGGGRSTTRSTTRSTGGR